MSFIKNLAVSFVITTLLAKGSAFSFESSTPSGDASASASDASPAPSAPQPLAGPAGSCIVKPEIESACTGYKLTPTNLNCEDATFGDGDNAKHISILTLTTYLCEPARPFRCTLTLTKPERGCHGSSEKACGQEPRSEYCVWQVNGAPPAGAAPAAAAAPAAGAPATPPPADNSGAAASAPATPAPATPPPAAAPATP